MKVSRALLSLLIAAAITFGAVMPSAKAYASGGSAGSEEREPLIGGVNEFELFEVSEEELANVPLLAVARLSSPLARAYVAPVIPGGTTYGYNWIKDPSNTGADAANLAALYEALSEAANEVYASTRTFTEPGGIGAYYAGKCDISTLNMPFDDEAWRLIRLASYSFHLDNPEFFFLAFQAAVTHSSKCLSIGLLASPEYVAYEERQRNYSIVNAKYAEYEIAAASGNNPYEKVKIVHDKMANERDYSWIAPGEADNNTYAHNIMGIMDVNTRGPVCEAYTKSYTYILNRLGIDTISVVGGGHAWNLVKMGPYYYYVDVTWDDVDGGKPPIYDYFLVGSGNTLFTSQHHPGFPRDPNDTIYGMPNNISAEDYTPTSSDQTIDIYAIEGVTAPVIGQTPKTAVTETAQYTGTISWNPSASTFAADTEYAATITLTPKSGYTLDGVPANFFTVAGASSCTNASNSGVVTALFPATNAAATTLTVTAPTFAIETIGYARPAAKAITIRNTGSNAAAISEVTVSSTTAFEVTGSGSSVAAGGTITSWSIQPKAGLAAGTYNATITVSYNSAGGSAATADVTFKVNAVNETVSGDVNGDGVINIQDVSRIFLYLRNKAVSPLTDAQLAAADVNHDGVVNIQDVSKLFLYLRNKELYPLN